MRQYFSFKTLDLAAPWILFVLIVWLCWKLAALIWLILAPPQPPVAREIPLSYNQSMQVPNISGFSLFKENRVDLPSGQSSNEAQIPLKLEGIFLGRPARNSAAVIRANNVSNRYRMGQQIEGTNQRLIAVAWDHVTLGYGDGREATLYFGDEGAMVAGPATVTPTTAALNNANTEAQQAQNALGDAIRQLQSNPSGYLSQMGVQPSDQGYEVSASAPAEIRNKLGLRPGDRIVSLNGRPLGQIQNDIRALQQIQQQRNAQIEIRRGEQTMTIQQNF
jgi:general secretion pathway protein C